MNDAEQVRTVWSWDTTDVEKATKRIEQHFARVDAAEKKSVQASATNKKAQASTGGGGGHGASMAHGGGNIGMGIHDTLMGRGTAGLFRFGNAAKLAAGYASGMAIAIELGRKAMAYEAAEIDRTTKAAERLEQSFVKVSKAATFSSVGEGPGKLGGTQESLWDQIIGERAQQGDLRNQQLLQDSRPFVDPVTGEHTLSAGGLFYKAKDRLSSALFGSETVESKIRGSELRERAAGQQFGKLNRQVDAAQGTERDIAYEKSFRGNPYEAQRLELGKKEGAEIAQEQSRSGHSDESLARIRERYAIEKEGIDRAEAATKRQLNLEWEITRAKREGGAVEVRSAKERMDAAGKNLSLEIPGTQSFTEKQNAFFASRDDYHLARRGRRIERASFRFDEQAASNHGSDDERAASSAQLEVDKAKDKLRILRETKGVKASTQEIDEATLELAKAETAQVLLSRQIEEARLKLAADIRRAPESTRAAGALLGGASSDNAARAGLVDQARAAEVAFDLAKKRVEIEEGSREALEGQVAAAKALADAQLTLAQHEQQVRRERRYEMQAARTETAGLRLEASGRDDLAQRETERGQSRIAVERANQAGRPELARELAGQQDLREQKTLAGMYLDENGRRRNPALVQREINERRLKQKRFEAFNREHPMGLTNLHRGSHGELESGVDMLTGQRLNARQIAERGAAANAKIDTKAEEGTDNELLGKIFTALDSRLPKEAK